MMSYTEKKADSSFPIGHQLPIAPWLGVGFTCLLLHAEELTDWLHHLQGVGNIRVETLKGQRLGRLAVK